MLNGKNLIKKQYVKKATSRKGWFGRRCFLQTTLWSNGMVGISFPEMTPLSGDTFWKPGRLL